MTSFEVGVALRRTAYVMLGIAIGVAFSTIAVLARRVRIASAVVAALELWRRSHPASAERRAQVAAIEDRVFGFTSRHPGRVPALLALEGAYQMAGVMEIWLALTLITGASTGFVTAFVLEFVNRTVIIAFQFVPLWLGVDEAGTGLVTTALHLGAAAGMGLALVRKARVVMWTSLGLGLLFLPHSWVGRWPHSHRSRAARGRYWVTNRARPHEVRPAMAGRIDPGLKSPPSHRHRLKSAHSRSL